MDKIIDLIDNENLISKNDISELLIFMTNSINKIDKIVTIRTRKINFNDLFYFIIKYNIICFPRSCSPR